MLVEHAVVSQLHMIANYTVRPHLHPFAELGLWRDDGSGMDHRVSIVEDASV